MFTVCYLVYKSILFLHTYNIPAIYLLYFINYETLKTLFKVKTAQFLHKTPVFFKISILSLLRKPPK